MELFRKNVVENLIKYPSKNQDGPTEVWLYNTAPSWLAPKSKL